jgi:hemerythrin-like domain-containing protein
MEMRAPIKRSKELITLSREHHDGLLLCWKINSGLDKGIAAERIVSYVLNVYENNLDTHFTEEEQHVFTLLPAYNIYRLEAENEHKILRGMIKTLASTEDGKEQLLRDFALALQKHIRYEERVLFNLIEKEAGNTALHALGGHLSRLANSNTQWHDQFWLKEK